MKRSRGSTKYTRYTERLKTNPGVELKCHDEDYVLAVYGVVLGENEPKISFRPATFPNPAGGAPAALGSAAVYGRAFPVIKEGNTSYERQGRMITLKKCNFRITLRSYLEKTATAPDPTATLGAYIVRVIIVIDFQANSEATSNAFNSLLGVNKSGTTERYFDSFRNMSASTRFKTLVDQTIPMNEMYDGDDYVGHLNYNFKMNLPVTFGTTTLAPAPTADTCFTQNCIRVFIIGATTKEAAHDVSNNWAYPMVSADVHGRFRYTDS